MDQQPNQMPAAGQPVPPPPAGQQKNTLMAVVAYFLFFVPLLTDAKKEAFVKYHVKQGLGMLLVWILWNIISMYIFLFGFEIIISLAIIVLWIMGIVNAAQGKEASVPLIGHLFEKFNF